MKPLFNRVKVTRPKTNTFDLSHEKKLSCKMGDLVPIFLQEVVPGDRFRVNSEIFARLAPMLAPIMHRVNLSTHYFFVPNRLVFDKWEEFITGGENGTLTPVHPILNINTTTRPLFQKGSLADFLGVPAQGATVGGQNYPLNALPFRAYQLIYNEYYRDQNLQTAIPFSRGEGYIAADNEALLTLRRRCWEKDYFTSALPWAQRGGEVLLPFQADVNYLDTSIVKQSLSGNPAADGLPLFTGNDGLQDGKLTTHNPGGGYLGDARIENIDTIENGTTTINDLRKASKLQEWLEKNARGGSRYIEQIFSHFGVKSSDARLQRPEYLGGSKQPIVISEVLSTYSQVGDAPQGTMAGHGISVGAQNGFTKYFEEHGFIIGIMSVLPRTAYQQGLPRVFWKTDKFDYYFPEFANIGEQEIRNGELYYDTSGSQNANTATFGYQSRYAEYKFQNSSVHGDFRDTHNYWHMGRIFKDDTEGNNYEPININLNADFVISAPTQRVFAVTDPTVDNLYVQLYNNVSAIRPMPVFGTPTF